MKQSPSRQFLRVQFYLKISGHGLSTNLFFKVLSKSNFLTPRDLPRFFLSRAVIQISFTTAPQIITDRTWIWPWLPYQFPTLTYWGASTFAPAWAHSHKLYHIPQRFPWCPSFRVMLWKNHWEYSPTNICFLGRILCQQTIHTISQESLSFAWTLN